MRLFLDLDRGLVDYMNWEIAAEGSEPLVVGDMGEVVLVLSQTNAAGKSERGAVSFAQLAGAMNAASLRYGFAKNTDCGAALEAV